MTGAGPSDGYLGLVQLTAMGGPGANVCVKEGEVVLLGTFRFEMALSCVVFPHEVRWHDRPFFVCGTHRVLWQDGPFRFEIEWIKAVRDPKCEVDED